VEDEPAEAGRSVSEDRGGERPIKKKQKMLIVEWS